MPTNTPFRVLSILVLAAAASAQVAHTDRAIADVRIVHPPGTPPGTYRVETTIAAGADDASPAGSDHSMDLVISLNDTPISTELVQVTQSTQSTCDGIACFLHVSCSGWQSGPFTLAAYCETRYGWLCACWMDVVVVGPNMNLYATDRITATVTPHAGSVSEAVTSDDSLTVVVGEHDPAIPTCSGDGTLPVPCPCGNNGAAGHGCANSANASGALLTATGFTEIDPLTGTDAVVLHGSGMPATSSCIYLKSDGLNPAGAPFGDGVSCLGGNIIRLRTKFNVGGASRFPEPGDPSLSVRGATPPGSGVSGWYQVFYRNAASYCTPATYNISGGLRIDW